MKILHIDPDDIDSPESGGGPVRTFQIYKRLACRHEITVLTPSFDGAQREQIRDGIRYLRIGNKVRDHKSMYYISFYLLAPFIARKFEYDLLVEDLMPPTAATITPLLNKKPIIASVQWFFAKEWACHFKIPFHYYQKIGLKFYKNFIILTNDMKQKITKFNSKANCFVIPNAIDERLFNTVSKSENFILFLGRLDIQQKGLDILIKSFKRIADQIKEDLYIAGEGSDYKQIKNLVDKLGLNNRVKFLGLVDFKQKADLLSRCKFLCMPSKFETFGISALEAFACSKPIIAFDIPNLKDVMRLEFSFIAKPFDEKDYSEKILSALKSDDILDDMGKKAKKYALDFSWNKIALLQESFYEKVLFEYNNK